MLCLWTGVPALTEEDLTNLSPTAAVVAKIVKPGMKLMEVGQMFFLFYFQDLILCSQLPTLLALNK